MQCHGCGDSLSAEAIWRGGEPYCQGCDDAPSEVEFPDRPCSRSASAVPGDDLRELTAPQVDTEGRRWPKGTRYRPLSHGNSGVCATILR